MGLDGVAPVDLLARLPEKVNAAQGEIGKARVEQGGELLEFMQRKVYHHDNRRHADLPFFAAGRGGRVGQHKEHEQIKRGRCKRAHKQRFGGDMMAQNIGAQAHLGGVEQQKRANQPCAVDVHAHQHDGGGGNKKGHHARAAPLIGGRGRYHAAAKKQRGNNAKQRGVVNMLAVYGEQIFGRDGEKRRQQRKPNAVREVGEHGKAGACNRRAEWKQRRAAAQDGVQG